MRLMLIEDDPVFIRTLSDRLQDEGHTTREFLDPDEALEALRRAPGGSGGDPARSPASEDERAPMAEEGPPRGAFPSGGADQGRCEHGSH